MRFLNWSDSADALCKARVPSDHPARRRIVLNRRKFIALACSCFGTSFLGISLERYVYAAPSEASPAPAVINAWMLIGAGSELAGRVTPQP
jgi:hypothetical protein